MFSCQASLLGVLILYTHTHTILCPLYLNHRVVMYMGKSVNRVRLIAGSNTHNTLFYILFFIFFYFFTFARCYDAYANICLPTTSSSYPINNISNGLWFLSSLLFPVQLFCTVCGLFLFHICQAWAGTVTISIQISFHLILLHFYLFQYCGPDHINCTFINCLFTTICMCVCFFR